LAASVKTIENQSLTKSVLNWQSPEVWRKADRESDFWGLSSLITVLRFVRERRPLLGFRAISTLGGERSFRPGWRRECDWDPTVSEFVAIILLGRVRLESNRWVENTRESASLVCESGANPCQRRKTEPRGHTARSASPA
jgi:hypothetical protein